MSQMGEKKKKIGWFRGVKRPRVEKEETEQYAQHKVQAVRLQRLIKTVDDWQEKGETTQFVNLAVDAELESETSTS